MDDIVTKIPISDQDVYVMSGGRILRRSDKFAKFETDARFSHEQEWR